MEQKPHVAIVPSPGMGHLIPLVQLAKQLLLSHEISVTFIVPTPGPPTKAIKTILEGLPEGANYVLLPVHFEEGARVEANIALTMTRSLSSVRDVVKSLVANSKLMAVVVDMFGSDVSDVAKEFDIPSYMLYLSTAMTLSLLLHLPKLDKMISCEYRDLQQPIALSGFSVPVHGRDLPEQMQDRKNKVYEWLLRVAKRCSLAEGIMINTFNDLEPGVIKALQKEPGMPPIYPIGPLIQTASSDGVDDSECIRWLDEQPNGSVLFVSFGSGGTLSSEQLFELALGLEMSEQKFLWVVRSPNDTSGNASYFSVDSNTDPLGFLPKGFLDRTKKQGFVVPSWAPQIQVLSHRSTGGFLTHCGWNSTLESIVHGVPLIVWPLYAEQRTNAVMLVDDDLMKVGLRPEANENGLVRREEVAAIVKSLMGGEEGRVVRNRMKRLQEDAAKAISEEGSSTKTLSELVLKLKNGKSL